MGAKIARLASAILTAIAILTVSTASAHYWHNPVPEELLKKKSK